MIDSSRVSGYEAAGWAVTCRETCVSCNMKSKFGKYENYILTLIVIAVNVLLMGVLFDFYYDLNDDTMMHDIMAGVYSGTPDGHNMQTLYPLGVLIALCYRICRTIPWYGLFLCLCQFGCFYLIGVRLCALKSSRNRMSAVAKLVLLLGLSLYMWGVCLFHLVDIQYTVTCAILSAGAIFLFMTTQDGLSAQRFVVKNVPSVVLVVVAYQIRSEMLLLTFPFICLAGLYRLTEEKEIFAKENLYRYGGVLGIILAGMILSFGLDKVAYGSAAWKDFREFFDARTTVYDFYPELITDESYSVALTELGVEPHQQTLLNNYNFGLDDTINTELLTKMADYAVDTIGASKDWTAIARRKIGEYVYRTFHSGDAPYNVMVLWAYAAVFIAGLCVCLSSGRQDKENAEAVKEGAFHRYAFVWQLALLAAVRSALWMFILMRGRDPVRITHSLYLTEFALLVAMHVRQLCAGVKGSGVVRGMAIVAGLIIVCALTDSVSDLREDQSRREWVNEGRDEIDAYCREHADNFYFEDVYSTVSFSQRLFERRDNSYANYDIMGGWMCKSPLYCKKLQRSGIASASEALCTQDNVYLIVSDAEMSEQGTDWITAYYAAEGIWVDVVKTDDIGDLYSVYQIIENDTMLTR